MHLFYECVLTYVYVDGNVDAGGGVKIFEVQTRLRPKLFVLGGKTVKHFMIFFYNIDPAPC